MVRPGRGSRSGDRAFGPHAVEAVLAKNPALVTRLLVQAGMATGRLSRLVDTARRVGVATEECSRRELDALAGGGRHQGVVAELRQAPARTEAGEQELKRDLPAWSENPLVLVLDGVQDPRNLGACLRTAAGVGAAGVVAPRDRAVGLTGGARKAAAGAAETVPLYRVANLARALRTLRDAGFWLIGADADGGEELYDTDLTGSVAVVLGGEEKGLRRLTREHCDRVVRIPLADGVESLNVSVAAAVCLFEAVRQRRLQRPGA